MNTADQPATAARPCPNCGTLVTWEQSHACLAPAATSRTWPEHAQPTPEQLAEWLTRCTDEERVTLCGKMLDSSERAARCFRMDHDWLQHEVDRLNQAITRVLRLLADQEAHCGDERLDVPSWVGSVRRALNDE